MNQALIAAVLAAALPACHTGPSGGTASDRAPFDPGTDFDAFLLAQMSTAKVPGLALALVERDTLLLTRSWTRTA